MVSVRCKPGDYTGFNSCKNHDWRHVDVILDRKFKKILLIGICFCKKIWNELGLSTDQHLGYHTLELITINILRVKKYFLFSFLKFFESHIQNFVFNLNFHLFCFKNRWMNVRFCVWFISYYNILNRFSSLESILVEIYRIIIFLINMPVWK